MERPILDRKLACFYATFEGDGTSEHPEWFAGWLLTQDPKLAPILAKAQRGRRTPAEQAMRAMVEIIGFEHQGAQREVIDRRKVLRPLSSFPVLHRRTHPGCAMRIRALSAR